MSIGDVLIRLRMLGSDAAFVYPRKCRGMLRRSERTILAAGVATDGFLPGFIDFVAVSGIDVCLLRQFAEALNRYSAVWIRCDGSIIKTLDHISRYGLKEES